MKFNKKSFISLLILSCFVLTSVNSAQAFLFQKKKNNTQAVSVTKTKGIHNGATKKNGEVEQPPYTNEVHSAFTLNDCIENAIKYNPAIQASIFNEDIYNSRIGQAWANYFPVISAGLQVSRSGNKYSDGGPYGVPMKQYLTMGYVPTVSADMLLFDFGKTKATADMAKRLYEATQEDTKENINTVIYNIKASYYNILFAQAQVQVYEDTVADYELQLNQAQGFYRYGTKPKLDVVTAEYNLGKAKLNLVKARNVLDVAKVQLSKIMGIPEYTNYELCDQLTLDLFDITEEDAINSALEVRPELIAAKKNAEAAKMNLRAAKREFTPNIGIYGSYQNGLGNDYDLRSGQVGLGLNYSGFNMLRLKKQVDEAKAEYKRADALYKNIKHDVYFNVKKNYMDLETDREAILIAKLALDQAKEQYRQVTGRYKAGVGDAIELKDGENTYLNARLDFYNAMLNYNTTAASLEKEIGLPLKRNDKKILDIQNDDL
ncbi:TolC family protein [bacterium]|nr:TolC family protein [bacterium]